MKIIFAGTPDFAVPALQMLLDSEYEVCAVYTQPDRPAGRGRKLTPSPVKVLATDANRPVFQPDTFKSPEAIEQLKALQADLIIVVAYGMILPQHVLDIPPLGCLNIHGSLLPRWRGAAPIHRAIIAGDTQTGITIMRVIQKLDAGDMLHKEVCDITATSTSAELHDKLAQLGAIGLQKVLKQLQAGQLIAEKQDESLVTYAEKVDKSEAVLDWHQSAQQLDRTIRGLNSWPVAHTLYQGQVLRIWQAALSDINSTEPPGSLICQDKQLYVATGTGSLQLLEIQLPGGKRMNTHAFLNAHEVANITLGA